MSLERAKVRPQSSVRQRGSQRTAAALGEKSAEVADAREALGENMLQEPPQELFVRERHGAALAVVRIVLPAKRHVIIRHLDQTMVGRWRHRWV